MRINSICINLVSGLFFSKIDAQPSFHMLKKTFFQIHWFLGITAGLILSLMGVTGAIYSYEQQILKWLNPDSYQVQVEQKPKLTPAEIYTHFQQVQPNYKINSITIVQDPAASSSINIEKEGARRGQNIMINPYSADILPEVKGREFFQFIQQLHRNLTIGPIGKQITGACSLILIFFVLSGVYLRWPKRHSFKQWFAIKPQLKGRNFIWDLHAVVGTWVVIFYLVMACTGLYWSYDWWRNGMFKVMGVERPQVQMQADGHNKKENLKTQTSHQATQIQVAERRANTTLPAQKNTLDQAQINLALTQAWQHFPQQLEQDYSSITFNVPKHDNREIEINFIDVIPQHERARNTATFDYQQAHITQLELYADKQLNEKIMSSMLPVHRGSFFGPVYQFLAMLAALMMPLFFVTGWMLYLKRRKQKRLTLAARQNQTQFNIDPNAEHWLIVYSSQTGTAEQLAWRTATSLQEAHQPVTVKAIQELQIADLKNNTQILFVASTYGTGDAPDLSSNFVKKIMSQSLDLSHLRYAVLALGSKEYPDSYCDFGHRLAAWLQRNQAHALFDTIEVDNANPADVQRWNQALAQVTQLELQSMQIDKTFDTWRLQQRDLLNPNSLGSPAFNIELVPQHEAHWAAGDIAEIQPENSSVRIQDFLKQHQLDANTIIADGQQTLAQALAHKDLTTPIQTFKTVDELLAQLSPLPSREYSIASIPSQQVLRLVVRQKFDAQGELGLGSGWLTAHAALGQNIALRIRNNPSFHLIDDDRPMICIGNGTGLAGLMSLLHARNRLNYTQNWLFFGERQQAHDYFYQRTIEAWQSTGVLQRLDLAFSRDQAEKVYIHHKLREQAEELKRWIEQDAVIYVCGSIDGMASDVDQALKDILGETQLEQLRQQGRYRRDVY